MSINAVSIGYGIDLIDNSGNAHCKRRRMGNENDLKSDGNKETFWNGRTEFRILQAIVSMRIV